MWASTGAGHSEGMFERVSGAIHLADVGVEIRAIMLLARWGSEVVMRYVRDAPLRNLTGKYFQGWCCRRWSSFYGAVIAYSGRFFVSEVH